MKIVILDGYTENPGDLSWDEMAALGSLTVYDRTPPEQIVSRIGDAEAVIINKTPMTEATFNACPNIRYVGVLATGYNVVDIHAADERGIVVTNIPTYGTTAVAQYVFALLLAVCHHVEAHSLAVKEGQWSACKDFCFWNYPLIELKDKTMGIIGFGRIGQATAKLAVAFGMNVLAFDSYVDKSLETDRIALTDLDTLFAQSDVISLHCPLTPSTQGIINKQNIARMRNGAILINTSRGPLVVEEDLRQALEAKKLYAAAVDVVSTEPIQENNPLLGCENCLITPHIAWAPKESRARLMQIAVDNLRAFQDGQPVNAVNIKRAVL